MTTEQVDAQLEEIRNEVQQAPLLSDAEQLASPSCTVRVEFSDDDVMRAQLDDVVTKRTEAGRTAPVMVRYARRDGNCFYRCSSFALFRLMRTSAAFARQCREVMVQWKPLLSGQFGAYSADFHDVVYEQVQPLCKEDHGVTEAQLLAFLTGDEGPYALVYFRYLVSLYLRTEAEFYLPFVMAQDYATMEAYCEAEVEPVDHVSDDTQLVAFANIFDIRLDVYALDRTAGRSITHHVFHETSPAERTIELLFRPGHYDLIL